MIKLSNGQSFTYVNSSGSLGFDCLGWWWERPLVWFGFIKPKLFANVVRTATLNPRLYPVSNLSWIRPWTWLPWSPWSCVRFLPGGAVNKVGLYNPGFEWLCEKVYSRLDFKKYKLIASIHGTKEELVQMAWRLNCFDFVAIEINVSCPNTEHKSATLETIESTKAVAEVCCHPIIIKISADQDYITIARALKGCVQAISLNSVPWKTAFPDEQKSPLWKLEQKRGGGGGGVSGKPAQRHNWAVARRLVIQGLIPVICPGIMNRGDLVEVRGTVGPGAYSFGTIYLRKPWLATQIVEGEMKKESNHSS